MSNGFSAAGVAALGNNGLNANGQVISSGQAGTLYTPGELVFAPQGFNPQEALKEDDYQYNAGVKFNVAGWDVDANLGYGKDIDQIYVYNSGNRSLFIDTHFAHEFHAGGFTASEFIGTIDATHAYNVGMASPLTVAVGAEAREDLYQIRQGDFASTYKEVCSPIRASSQPTLALIPARIMLVTSILRWLPLQFQLDVAGRFEHYTDFGDANRAIRN